MLSISLRFHCLSPDMFCTAFSHEKPPRNIHAARDSRRITYGIGCVWGMPSLSPLSSLEIRRRRSHVNRSVVSIHVNFAITILNYIKQIVAN